MILTISKVKIYYRMVFYTFLGFQGHIICNFWINRTEDMIFQSFKLFLFLNLNSDCDLIEGCHVFCFIGRYPFGWITVCSRWIKVDLNDPDLNVPFH
jgi:hypothetical protein